ncbi:hypothetical protein SNOG_05414 [Parastagonospora nodorum SN15]|uniref:Uncharacterized protein n=1 Tax=Phaeosphaeria nodorum (strain SN15 / ATCC MYA-4574 / FGSC 10173) TaxID=321614 RepID=Q0US50_PHANO|nr:hypothetical protein SNOG_05414 [Parastagonospora nodorum SN15]EAT87805.1 hypothetical protein SNOG_05414 [Parastagonospora nodorum SN15]
MAETTSEPEAPSPSSTAILPRSSTSLETYSNPKSPSSWPPSTPRNQTKHLSPRPPMSRFKPFTYS